LHSSAISHTSQERSYSMKPVSMWVTLGISLFLALNAESIDGRRIPIPAQGEFPPDPLPVSQTKPQNGTPTIQSGSLTATVFINGSGELFVGNSTRQGTQTLRVPPELPPGGLGSGTTDIVDFRELLPTAKGKPGISQIKTLSEGEEVEF